MKFALIIIMLCWLVAAAIYLNVNDASSVTVGSNETLISQEKTAVTEVFDSLSTTLTRDNDKKPASLIEPSQELVLSEEQQRAYEVYSEIYNGIFDVDPTQNNNDKYQLLPHELEFVIDNDVRYVTSIVTQNIDDASFPIIDIDGRKMNAFNLQALSMALTLKGLEKEVQYYFPEYEFGKNFPVRTSFDRSDDYPPSVKKYILDIITISQTMWLNDPRIHLAEAKALETDATQYGASGHKQIVELFAEAQQTLQSNTLREYVEKKYPDHLVFFLEKSGDLTL